MRIILSNSIADCSSTIMKAGHYKSMALVPLGDLTRNFPKRSITSSFDWAKQ